MDFAHHLNEAIKRSDRDTDFDNTSIGESETNDLDKNAEEKDVVEGKPLNAVELTYADEDLVRMASKIIMQLRQKASRAECDLDINYAKDLRAAAEHLEERLCEEDE